MKSHTKTSKERAVHRLRIIRGHIDAIEKMINDDRYCVDVIMQSRAVQKALKKFDKLIMKNHLEHCVADQMKSDKAKATVEELLSIYNMS